MSTTTIKYFAFAHLPAHLQLVSKPIGELAQQFEQQLPDGPEKSAGMRKLLEAKDCFVRAALEAPKPADIPRTAPGPLFPGYGDMQPHQQRVIDEKCELSARLSKLTPFFDTPIFAALPEEEKQRLERQEEAMKAYSDILTERIAAFTAAASAPA